MIIQVSHEGYLNWRKHVADELRRKRAKRFWLQNFRKALEEWMAYEAMCDAANDPYTTTIAVTEYLVVDATKET